MSGDHIRVRDALFGKLPGDVPLLQEIGVDFRSIKEDVIRSLLAREGRKATEDLFGPFIFYAVFSLVLAARGRVHVGYLYFLSILSSFFIYLIISLVNSSSIGFFGIVNVLGYAFIPTMVFGCISAVFPGGKVLKIVAGMFFGLWSTSISVREIVSRFNIRNKLVLVAYPVFLVYMCFIIIAII